MSKIRWLLAIGGFICGCIILLKVLAPSPKPETFFSKFSPAVVRIVTLDRSGQPLAYGSGFFVSADGLLVTNHHVTRGGDSFSIVLSSNASLRCKSVLAADADADLALLKVDAQDLPYLSLASQEPEVGAKVYAIGNPQGLTNTLSDGIVSGVRKAAGTPTLIQTTAPISPGSSGGPLLDTDGNVLGVTTLYLATGQNLNFAVGAAQVKELLKRPAWTTAPLASGGASFNSELDPKQSARFWLGEAMKHAAGIKIGQSDAYQEIAKHYARLKDRAACAEAVRLAHLTMDEHDLERMPAELVQILLQAGDVEGALKFADLHLKPEARANAYRTFAESLKKSGDLKRGVEYLRLALALEDRPNPPAQNPQRDKFGGIIVEQPEGQGASSVARRIRRALDEALYLHELDTALSIAQQMKDSSDPKEKTREVNAKSWAMCIIVRDFVTSDVDRMKTTAGNIFNDGLRDIAWRIIARELAKSTRLDEADAIASTLADPESKSLAYVEIARTIVQSGDRLKLRDYVQRAFKAAREIEPDKSSGAFQEIANVCADVGDFESAVAAAARISGEESAWTFRSLAEKQASAGDTTGALATVYRISDSAGRRSTVEAVAIETAKRGDYVAAFAAAEQFKGYYANDPDLFHYRSCIGRVMAEQAKAGHYADVSEKLRVFEQSPSFRFERDRVYEAMAVSQAEAGLLKMAIESAAHIEFENTRARAFRAIAKATIQYGAGGDRHSWIDALPTPVERCYVYLGMADALSGKEAAVRKDIFDQIALD